MAKLITKIVGAKRLNGVNQATVHNALRLTGLNRYISSTAASSLLNNVSRTSSLGSTNSTLFGMGGAAVGAVAAATVLGSSTGVIQTPQSPFTQSSTGVVRQSDPLPFRFNAPSQNVTSGQLVRKGQKISLSQLCSSLSTLNVIIGWDFGQGAEQYDLDVEAFLLGSTGKVLGDDWFVFYNQVRSPDNAVQYVNSGMNRQATMNIQLGMLSSQVNRIVFILTINEAKMLHYNFSHVRDAYLSITESTTNRELLRFKLTDYYSSVYSMMLGEIYKHNGDWKFNAIGDGTQDDLSGLCRRYGVNIQP